MELRVLHTAARGMTWYGQWHYGFGRGGFNMSPQQARAGRGGGGDATAGCRMSGAWSSQRAQHSPPGLT